MSTKDRIRTPLAALAVSLLLLPLLPLCGLAADHGTATPARALEPITLTIEGQSITLTPQEHAIALFFPDRTSDARRDSAASAIGLAASLDRERLPYPSLDLYRLDRPEDEILFLDRARNARSGGGVRHASAVYQWRGITLIPTGDLFVQLSPGEDESTLDRLLQVFGLELLERTSWKNGNFRLRPRADNARDLWSIVEELEAQHGVAFAEADLLQRLPELSPPDDPLFGSQWNLDNPGTTPWAEDCDLDAPEGWEVALPTASARIAILDEGCESHADLNLGAGWDFVENDADASPNWYDTHGTKCAGAAAAIHNTIGVAGVANGAAVIPVRIAYKPDPSSHQWITTTAWLAGGIAFAANAGADVLSNSWGGGPPSPEIHAAIRHAMIDGRGGLGALVLFAAGNDDSPSPSWPALYDEAICVVATDPCDERKTRSAAACQIENFWGSNYGLGSDLAAPGVAIPTTTNGGGYVTDFNGTSSATPQAAGVAALLALEFPQWRGTELRARLEQTCDKVGGYSYDATTGVSFELGHGRVNLYRALTGKPQVQLGPLPKNPSSYLEASDQFAGYPSTFHRSAAYEWLGEEWSPEVLFDDPNDPDGVRNRPGRDGFDDGVTFYPPYIPGQLGKITIQVSVENANSRRYVTSDNPNLYLNVWFDWQCDNSWNQIDDWMVQNFVMNPSTWGGANSQSVTLQFVVPSNGIQWRVQSPAAQRFLNVRTRLTYGQTLPATGAGLLTTWGEVEDDRILNFVEMFDQGPGNMVSLPSGCDPWRWCDGPQFWLPGCPPLFLPDQGQNGYMAVYWDSQPQYLGDSFDSFRTPDFDLSELTEAHLSFQYSAVEVVEKIRVVLYKNGAPFANLALLDGIAPNAYPCGGPPHDALIDLSPFCEDGFTNVAVAFEVDWDEPCVTPPMIPQHYVDFVLDNVCLWGEDKIAPGATTVTATATSENTTVLNWIAPGDDDLRHRAELYNLRYSPWPIDASNWRRAMWVRRDMANIPTPGVPGTVEGMTVSRLESGLHHFAVLTQDEVNNLSVPSEGGLNHPPTITSPGAQQVTARSNLTLTLSASDPDFDRLFLICTQKPSGADFQDQGNGTATFSWTPGPSDVGSTTVSVTARDWNGASSSTDFTINVLPAPSGGRGACCMKSTGCCLLLTAAQCSAQGASFHGVGTPCDPNPCLAPGVDFADHAVGAIKLTMTDQGTIGFMDASQSQGSGLRYPSTSTNHLYIGGLWVGNQSFVANRDFDADPNKDWVVSTCPDGQITSASQGTKQTLTSRYIDAGALAPLGLAVTQESWALSSPGSDDDFVIVRCTLSNDSGAPLGGLYAGLFLDLDIRGNGADDLGGTDGGRKLVYIGDASNTYVGLRTLDWNGGAPLANLTLIPNLTYVYPNAYILDADKGAFLTAADAPHIVPSGAAPGDYSALVSVGPFDLPASGARDLVFAVIGGSSLAALQQNADRAQQVWTGAAPTDVSGDAGLTSNLKTQILANRPNPFTRATALRFSLAEPGPAELEVIDASGRLVRSFETRDLSAGTHTLDWDGRDREGREVASGVYFVRLITGDRQDSRPIVLAR